MAFMGPGGGGRRFGATVTPEERSQAQRVPLGRVAALFRPYRGQITLVMLTIAVASVIGMASPFLLRAVINDALVPPHLRLLAWLVSGMVAVAAITAALGVVQTWVSTKVGQQVMHDLRVAVFAHLQRQSFAFFKRTRTGEIQSRINNDIGGMQSVVTSTATSIASSFTTTIATAVAMAALSWRLSLVSLIIMPPAILMSRRVARIRRRITTEQQRQLADLSVAVEQSLSASGIQLSRTLGAGPALVEDFRSMSERLIGLELRSQLAGRWRMASMTIVFAAIPAIIYLSAGFPGTAGTLSIGTLVAFTALQRTLFPALMGLFNVGVSLTSSLALFSRVFEYLDLPVEIDDPAEPVSIDSSAVRGEVRFEQVTFRYAVEEDAGLTNVDLEVSAGSTLGVVGETGSGKSTLAALVARLYDPTVGAVMIDGVDIRTITLDDLARIVGVVSQETYLLHASVRANLRYAKPGASDEEIVAAAKAARIHETIARLPEGYDTVVGSRGHRFSGGEQQRIAIARTLLRDPRVLVLDEATSALDNETERAVQEAFDDLARGRTTITIAHRLSTVRDADQIIVLDSGRVVEAGTHDSLLGQGGRYAALVHAAGEVEPLALSS